MQADRNDLTLTPPSDAIVYELRRVAPGIRYSTLTAMEAALVAETFEAVIEDYARLRAAVAANTNVLPFRPLLLDSERMPDDFGGDAA